MEKTIAERLHEALSLQDEIETIIMDAFEDYEPDIYNSNPDFGIEISTDAYDNSIEVKFLTSLPYPYEPCDEIRKIIYNLGFSNVYWNFLEDKNIVMCDRFIGKDPELSNTIDEIRNYEPRHYSMGTWISTKYGYVDERFNEKEWTKNYNFKKK